MRLNVYKYIFVFVPLLFSSLSRMRLIFLKFFLPTQTQVSQFLSRGERDVSRHHVVMMIGWMEYSLSLSLSLSKNIKCVNNLFEELKQNKMLFEDPRPKK